MKKRALVTVFLMSLLVLPALSVDAARQNYFPLNLHNEWTYHQTGPTVDRTVTVYINELVQTNQNIFFYKLCNFNGPYHWVRQSRTGVVTEKPRLLWYLFDNEVGKPWKMKMDEQISGVIPGTNEAMLTIVSRNEPVQIPAGNFNAIHIHYQTGVFDAGITDEWFAPGVGLIKREESSFAGVVSTSLTRAVIDGKIIVAE